MGASPRGFESRILRHSASSAPNGTAIAAFRHAVVRAGCRSGLLSSARHRRRGYSGWKSQFHGRFAASWAARSGYGVAVTNDSTYGPHGRSQHMPALPLRHLAGDHPVAPLVTVSNPAAVVEAVKLAEDGSGDLVVRLYESPGAGHGHRRRAGWIGIRDGSPGAASARGYRQRRSVYRPRAEAVPAGHVALPPLRASSYPSVVGVAGRHAPTGPNPTPRC